MGGKSKEKIRIPVIADGEPVATLEGWKEGDKCFWQLIDPVLQPPRVIIPKTSINPTSVHSRREMVRMLHKELEIDELNKNEVERYVDELRARLIELKGDGNTGSGKNKAKGQKNGEEDKKPTIKTTYLELDGSIIEQISGGRFIKWTPGKEGYEILNKVETEDAIYLPANSEEEEYGAVLLPEKPEEYESIEQLVEEIRQFIHRYVDVSSTFLTISAWYVLLTWVYERMNTLPYLRVIGDWGVGKSRYLDTVGGLCYRATIAAGAITPAPIYRLIRKWHGTLILEEADRRKSDETDEVVTILNCGFEKRRPVLRCTKDNPDELQVLPTFSPKIFATRGRFQDVALESRCLTEVMRETDREDIPVQLPSEFYEEQKRLRNKLLMFRIRNFHKIDPDAGADLDLGDVEPRLKQATVCFAALFKNIDGAYGEFKNFLKKLQREIVEERANTVEGAVVSALFALTHVTDVTNVTNVTRHKIGNREYIKLTSKEISEYLNSDGILKDIKPQRVGQILKTLGLHTEPVRIGDDVGRYIVYDERALKSLARRYLLKQDKNEDENGEKTDVTSVTAVTCVTGDRGEIDESQLTEAHRLNLAVYRYVKERGEVKRSEVIEAMRKRGFDPESVKLALQVQLAAGWLVEMKGMLLAGR